MIVLGLMLYVMSAGADAAPPISVAVFAPEDVTDSLVHRICAEAEAIWGSAGIAFEWHRLSPRAQPPAWTLDVTIDDRRTNGASDNALGWLTFTSAGPDRSIHLSRACAEELLLGTPGLTNVTITAHETLVGRALGRALGHELGHYLLRSKAHTSRGLMRADWGAGAFFSFDRDRFEPTPEQRAAAHRYARAIGPRTEVAPPDR
jgi:hypothetical protein